MLSLVLFITFSVLFQGPTEFTVTVEECFFLHKVNIGSSNIAKTTHER